LYLFICLRATEAALPGGFSIRRRLQTYTPAKAGGFSYNKNPAIGGIFGEN